MLQQVRNIGRAVRLKYDWMSWNTVIYLVLDNAEGHGTDEAKQEFERTLQKKYDIKCM